MIYGTVVSFFEQKQTQLKIEGKNDFKYLDKTTTDAETDTCLMYYDLTKPG